MAHDHSHPGHANHPPASDGAFAVGVALNVAFVAAEVIYGLSAHSLALLSDAGHNLGDVLGLLIAWGAVHLSRRVPTRRHTYGLRRSSILAALANAILLLVVVGGIAWEAVGRLFQPEAVEGTTVIWVAAAGVVVNTASALLFLAGRKRDLNVKGAFVHLMGDAAVSVGVVFAGLGIRATGWLWLDPAASLVIVGVVVWGTWGLLRESARLSMDAVPAGIDPHAVEDYLLGLPGVSGLHDLHIWGMSTTESALTVHLVMPDAPADDRFLHELCHGVGQHFGIGHVTVQVERGDPDIVCHQEAAHVV